MEPPVELDELMARIHDAVSAQRRDGRAAAIPGALSTLTVPGTVPDAERERATLELALAEAAVLLPKAAKKTEVRSTVPKLLRPLYRNQGGFNSTALEIMERLLEVNRQLRLQNLRLQERFDVLEKTAERQQDWIAATTRTHEQHRERLETLEVRLREKGILPAEAARDNTPS